MNEQPECPDQIFDHQCVAEMDVDRCAGCWLLRFGNTRCSECVDSGIVVTETGHYEVCWCAAGVAYTERMKFAVAQVRAALRETEPQKQTNGATRLAD